MTPAQVLSDLAAYQGKCLVANDSAAIFILPSIYSSDAVPECTNRARCTRLTVPLRALRAACTRKTPAQVLSDLAAYQGKRLVANDSAAHFILPSIYGPVAVPGCTNIGRGAQGLRSRRGL